MKKLMFCLALLSIQTTRPFIDRLQAEQCVQELKQQHVCFVSFLFSDILGNTKEVTIPLEHVQDALEHGISFDGSSIAGCGTICKSDMLLKPDISTIRIIPWLTNINTTACIICDIYRDQETPFEHDARSLLRRTIDDVAQIGYTFYVGPELEFFFIDPKTKQPIDQSAYFDLETNVQRAIQKTTLMHLLQQTGINVEKLHHEVATGQHEVSLKYGDACSLADQIILAKYVLRTAAREYGFHVTFMPKPFAQQNGSAMHIHFSLWDNIQQKNAFAPTTKDEALSPLGRSFIAGVLAHAKECSLLFNPTINSFKRLVKGYEAPVFICWGAKNRSALIRLPHVTNEKAVRAELRCPDPMCNPYLAFTALLKAGFEGISTNRSLANAIEENLYTLSADDIAAYNVQELPRSLEQAVDLFAQSSFSHAAFGQSLVQSLVALKHKEVEGYRLFVSEWERDRYL